MERYSILMFIWYIMLAAVMWLVVGVVFVGRGCAGVDGYGRGVDVVAVFSVPTQCLHSHIRLTKEPHSLVARLNKRLRRYIQLH